MTADQDGSDAHGGERADDAGGELLGDASTLALLAPAALSDLAREMAEASLDADRVVATVARSVSRLIGGLVVVQLLDRETRTLSAVAAADDDRARARFAEVVLPRLQGRQDPGVYADVVVEGRFTTHRRSIADFLGEIDTSAFPGPVPATIELAHAPMRARGRTVGVLSVVRAATSGQAGAYSDAEAAVLREVALHAALAIDNAEAHRRLADESAARRRAEVGLRRAVTTTELLAGLSQALAEVTLDFDAVLDTVVEKLTEAVADGAALYLCEPGTEDVRLAAAWYRDPRVDELIRTIRPAALLSPDSVVAAILRSSASLLIPELRRHEVGAETSEYRAMALAIGVHSVLGVPLVGRDGLRGVLMLGRIENRSPFGTDDVELCEALAARATLAIDNAALHRTIEEEIGERRRTERRLAYQATHDHLTDLANRPLFLERLGLALSRLPRTDKSVAVLFLDLDRFKVINDSLGHTSGDLLLREAAERLCAVTRPSDCLARLGGDEFAILVEDVGRAEDAATFARRINEAFAQPFELDGHEVFVTPSIGIALAGTADEDASELLRRADLAMYRAKESGRNTFEIFDDDMREQVMQRLQLEHALYRAIERAEFEVRYQPVFQVGLGGMPDEVHGFEALLAWRRDADPVPAAAFIDIAEDTGLIVPIGQWVLEQACRQLAAWEVAGHRGLVMHVNLSARQLSQPDVVDMVASILDATGVAPGQICLELTETAVMRDADDSLERLGELRALGVELGVDDFGTGYSSLTYLKRFPITVLKVDKSFVADLPGNRGDEAIVDAVITLGHALGLRVIAEGVESDAQLSSVVALGCDYAQGFIFSRPVPADAATAFLLQRSL